MGIYKKKIEQLYELYEQPLYRIAYAILNNVEQAEDAVDISFSREVLLNVSHLRV